MFPIDDVIETGMLLAFPTAIFTSMGVLVNGLGGVLIQAPPLRADIQARPRGRAAEAK